jgi:hypothetical protein
MDLTRALLDDRVQSYVRLKGGYTFPLAGAIYWGALALLGDAVALKSWLVIAFIGSGAIFPLAWGLSRFAGVNFMSDPSAAGSVVMPALLGMLLFWPMAVLAFWTAPALAIPILAIGMAMHWPVIGWSYGRPALYSAHAVARAIIVSALWMLAPEQRQMLIPAAVSFVYLATVVAILVDVAATKRAQASRR